MYKSSDVADRLRAVAKLRGVTMKDALNDAGLSFNLMTNMRKSMPNAASLAKLADRLECSVDYLLGRTAELATAGTGQASGGLRENSREMLALFEQLPERQQLILIGRLQEMVAPMAPAEDTIETGAPRGQEERVV
ncbi:helix-turn-helix domain-containing protein [Muriventricola aceti]|uniref:helix-turn-helix domain-containing protein n=1 Tax=Muriventricola aceti TaxID=2981773 RepID=UPI000821BF41|nr:helix-turn-helix domain-containing protein [Muriventricola aceti]MCU6701275.1 helix-turn-helix domain-containing protein [Muriventricola aceti]SCI56232.1 Uncharacterised protein [uncultured Flavonifractor sp.]